MLTVSSLKFNCEMVYHEAILALPAWMGPLGTTSYLGFSVRSRETDDDDNDDNDGARFQGQGICLDVVVPVHCGHGISGFPLSVSGTRIILTLCLQRCTLELR